MAAHWWIGSPCLSFYELLGFVLCAAGRWCRPYVRSLISVVRSSVLFGFGLAADCMFIRIRNPNLGFSACKFFCWGFMIWLLLVCILILVASGSLLGLWSIGSKLLLEFCDAGSIPSLGSPIAACEKPCDDGVLLGNSGHDNTLKDPPSRQHVLSLVETDLSKTNVDTSIIATNFKEQDSASTSVSTNLGAKVVIPITVVDDMCQKFTNTLYGYFIGHRLAFPLVEDYVKYAWAKFVSKC
ncbi:hypothetical protein CTI12_AA326680 [Artemisia annua]|uniref:Uncharacterized protein n=1 Tax=Artemisia annua TaxID=35608 RepID=A0A2U1MYX1_ARTAN|nr:hypothetical protein CTI12_AA326680 [Artemisia annua]